MSQTEEFLTTAVKAVTDADAALHQGDAQPRIALWGRQDPITVMGALGVTTVGWTECEALFRMLGEKFSGGRDFDVEIVAADVSGDLAYTVAFEDSVVSWDGAAPRRNRLRVTQVYRREGGEWRVVHRHGDHVDGFPRELGTEVPA